MESWTEYENSLQVLRTWFAAQEEKLKKKNRIEDLASVQNALKDCQVRTHKPTSKSERLLHISKS